MNTYIDKVYIECLRELDDIDATNLSSIEEMAKKKLKAKCKTDGNLVSAIKSDYNDNQQFQVQSFQVLCKLQRLYPTLIDSPTILNKFIQCLKNYQLYNTIVECRESQVLSHIITGLEQAKTIENRENIMEQFDKFLSTGNKDDLLLLDTLLK